MGIRLPVFTVQQTDSYGTVKRSSLTIVSCEWYGETFTCCLILEPRTTFSNLESAHSIRHLYRYCRLYGSPVPGGPRTAITYHRRCEWGRVPVPVQPPFVTRILAAPERENPLRTRRFSKFLLTSIKFGSDARYVPPAGERPILHLWFATLNSTRVSRFQSWPTPVCNENDSSSILCYTNQFHFLLSLALAFFP
jgi:hypothetical protein